MEQKTWQKFIGITITKQLPPTPFSFLTADDGNSASMS